MNTYRQPKVGEVFEHQMDGSLVEVTKYVSGYVYCRYVCEDLEFMFPIDFFADTFIYKRSSTEGSDRRPSESSDSINDDIMKMIESGYKFKRFYGETIDGREIDIDLSES